MKVNEIFYSLQGEGRWAGRAAIFIRLSGCNLKCPFCDTDFSQSREMNPWEIMGEVMKFAYKTEILPLVVITGGEPTLQPCDQLIKLLHNVNFVVAMESNGTRKIPQTLDWITISPKEYWLEDKGINPEILGDRINEIKLVFEGAEKVDKFCEIYDIEDFMARGIELYLQPCDTGNEERNKEITAACVEYIKQNPQWELSLQTQKILDVR